MKLLTKLNQNTMDSFTKKENVFILLVSVILIFSPLFYKINQEPLKRWDESLYAIVAYDLAYHGKALQTWDDFQGENYSLPVTKPKTLFWMQAGFMKIFGYDSKLAIRMPSLIATMLLMIFIIWFFYKEFNSLLMGIFSAFTLITIKAYMFHHIARAGDFDALMLLFTTMALVFYYLFIQYGLEQKSYRYLYLTFASLAGAVLFKNVAGLFMGPGLFLYTLYKRKLFNILSTRQFYFGIALFILIITPYYVFEALTFPHYFKELWIQEIGGRYGAIIDNNQRPLLYYFHLLFATGNHTPWILFLPLSVVIIWALPESKYRQYLVFSLIIIFTFLIIITFAQTKISHYIAPTYPFFAMIVGISLYFLFMSLMNFLNRDKFVYKILLLGSFGLALVFPTYLDIFQQADLSKTYENNCGFHYDVYEECFKEIREHHPEYKDLVVYRNESDWWIPQLIFYQEVYNDQYNFNIQISEDVKALKVNQNVVVCYSRMQDIQERYNVEVLLKFREIQVIRITGAINENE